MVTFAATHLGSRSLAGFAGGWRWPLLGGACWGLVAVLLWLLADWLWPQVDKPVRDVRVLGVYEHLDPQQVRGALWPVVGTPLMDMSLRDLKQTLEAEPWVRRAQVRRHWSGELQVLLKEELPVARWGEQGLLNNEGRIFWPQLAAADRHLPVLSGPEHSTREMMAQFHAFSHQLRPLGLSISALELEPRGAWTLRLNNGLKLVVGREPVMEKMSRFTRLYPRFLAPKVDQIEQIDIRYTNGLAVGWRQPLEPSDRT